MTPAQLTIVTEKLKHRALMQRARLRACFYIDVKAVVNKPDFIDRGEARIEVNDRYPYKNFSKSIHLSQSDYYLKAKVRL